MGDEANSSLNFDNAALENAYTGTSKEFQILNDAVYPGLSVVLFLLIVALCIYFYRRKSSHFETVAFIKIRQWPLGLQVALIPLISSFALTHIFSAASVYYNTKIANQNVELYFSNIGIGRLFSLSHAHLFAHAAMYFIMALLAQFTSRGPAVKVYAPLIALWAGVFDVVSWWGLKQVSSNFEILSALCGSSFSIGFLIMSYGILSEVFCCELKRNNLN